MKFRHSTPAPIGFQLAPMLDIVFLLLIFFVVTQTISLTEQDFSIKVASALNAKDRSKPQAINEIILNLRKDGIVTINGEEFTDEQLYPRLKRIARLDENHPIRIRGDAEASIQQFFNLQDICIGAGLKEITTSARKPDAPASP